MEENLYLYYGGKTFESPLGPGHMLLPLPGICKGTGIMTDCTPGGGAGWGHLPKQREGEHPNLKQGPSSESDVEGWMSKGVR